MNIPKLSSLSPEQKNVLIAEWRVALTVAEKGLHPIQNPPGTEGYKCDLSGLWIVADKQGNTHYGMNFKTPQAAMQARVTDHVKRHNYTTSLDACAEMRKALTKHQLHDYCVILSGFFWPVGWQDWRDTASLLSATPEQHVDAALLATGKAEL